MKRAWMLLLAVIALVALMTIPAMAAETHEHGTCIVQSACEACGQTHGADWTALTAGEREITTSGKYYLNADLVEANVTVSGAEVEVTVCLNGKTWTGLNGKRPLTVMGGAVVNIVDCSSRTDYVSAGVLRGLDLTAAGTDKTDDTEHYGGAAYVVKSTLNVYNGTITGGSGYRGGNVYLEGESATKKACFGLYGGVLTGTNAAKWSVKADGTAVSGYDASLYAQGGIVFANGGNLFANTYCEIVIGSQELQGTDLEYKVPTISGGCNVNPADSSKPNGGSIYVAGTSNMYFHSGIISEGRSVNIGHNMYINRSLLTMTGGKFYNTGASGSANIAAVNGNLTMSGGVINGRVAFTGSDTTCVIKLSGDAVIASEDGTYGVDLVKGSGATKAPVIQLVEPLGENARIAIIRRVAADTAVEAKNSVVRATQSGWTDYREYIYAQPGKTHARIHIAQGKKLALAFEATGINIYDSVVSSKNVRYRCVCGANGGESHLTGCDGYDVQWTEYPLDGATDFPASEGYWYLTDADGENDGVAVFKRKDVTSINGIYVDLNGVTAKQTSGVRMINIRCTSDTTPMLMVFTDSSQGHTGKILSATTGLKSDGKTYDHSNIWLRSGAASTNKKSTVTCYRTHFDFSGMKNSSGAGFVVSSGTFLNLYECHIIGGETLSGAGGAISNAGTTVVVGGSITGGIAKSNGGCINNSNGTLTLTGCDVNGGEAQYGGCISVSGGTLTMIGGTIQNGKATAGGNVYVTGGTFQVEGENPVIQNGIATYNAVGRTDSYGYGGNIYVNSGTFKMTAGTVKKGVVVSKTTDTWAPAGNIYANGGTVDISNATIIDGQNTELGLKQTVVDGNNLYINYNAKVHLRAGTMVKNSANNNQENITQQGGTLYIYEGATITAADGVEGFNLRTNNSSLTNQKERTLADGSKEKYYHFEYVERHPRIIMTGGTISNATYTAGAGGNVRIDFPCSFEMTGGTIKNGNCKSGGANIYVSALDDNHKAIVAYNKDKGTAMTGKDFAAKLHIGGDAKIIGGTITESTSNGGSIWTGTNTELTVDGNAEIYGGWSKGNCGGNIYSNGYVTIGGKASVYDGVAENASSAPNIFVVGGYLTLQGNAQVAGGITVTQTRATPHAVTLKDSVVVDKTLTSKGKQISASDISLSGGCYLVVENLTAAAQADIVTNLKYSYKVKVDGEETTVTKDSFQKDEATKGYIICADIGASDVSGLGFDNTGYYLLTDGTKLLLVPEADLANAVTVNGSKMLYNPATAVTKAGTNGLLQLQANCTADNVTIPSGVWIDLNGKTLAGKVTVTGGDLHLIDSLSADYNLEQDKDGNFIYGKLTATVEGTVEDSFTTMKQNGYKDNHRYIVLVDKDEDGNMTYHAHRIYLALKSVVLYPQGPHLQYRTNFKCDQVVAADAKYGVQISGVPYGKTEAESAVAYYASKVEGKGVNNERIAGLTNILDTEDADRRNHLATMEYTAHGYIEVNGQKFYSNSEAVTSFKAMVETVDDMWTKGDTGVTDGVKAALVGMYQNYSDLMSGWDITEIKAAADAASKKSK